MTITMNPPTAVDLSTLNGAVSVTLDNRPFFLVDPDTYKELLRAKHNIDYLDMLKKSHEQYKRGQVVVKTMEELEAMAAE